jgi:hypothetical protein
VIGRLVAYLGLAVALLLLWIMPAVFFPHPGVNDSLEFAYLGPLMFLVTLIVGLLSLVGVGAWGWRLEGPIGLGVFFLGVAAAFVLSIFEFGNFSDDRYAPLFLTPILSVPVGAALIVGSLVIRSRRRGRLLVGVARAAIAAAVVVLWLLVRGAPEWLQAPYGFDTYALITVAAVALFVLGADPMGNKVTASNPA